MNMMRKLTIALVLLSVVLLLFAACGEETGTVSGKQGGESTAVSAEQSKDTSAVSGEETAAEKSEADASEPTQGSSEEQPAVSGESETEEPGEKSSGETSAEPSGEPSDEPSAQQSEEPTTSSGETSSSETCKHSKTSWVVVKEASCEQAGQKKEVCDSCKKELGTETIPAKGHSFGAWTVTKQATESAEGERTATCSVCGAKKTEKIAKKKPLKAVDPSQYYGYLFLKKQPNASVLVDAYEKMVKNAGALAAEFTIPYLDEATLKTVFDCYMADYPQHFWLKGDYSYSYPTGSQTMTFKPSYVSFPGGIDKAKSAVESAVQKLLKLVDGSMTPYEIELTLHDALLNEIKWQDLNNDVMHTAYAAFVNHVSVCDGYTAAMRILLDRCGIETIKVCGSMAGTNHIWMMVKLDGVYYHLDSTADDPTGSTPCVVHGFFNLSTAEVLKTHKIFSNAYTIPECKSDKYTYSVKTGTVISKLSVDAIADAMVAYYRNVRQDMTFELFFKSITATNAADFIGDNLTDILLATSDRIPEILDIESVDFCMPESGTEIMLLFE